jgi:predicted transposase YbfD/YdcC
MARRGYQSRIAATILERGADYLLAVKDTQPALHDDIKTARTTRAISTMPRPPNCNPSRPSMPITAASKPARHVVSHAVGWLAEDSRFPAIKAIAMVENTFKHNGKTSWERRCHISSAVLPAAVFANAVRCHWHIENRLHWVLDVIFHEDYSRLRNGHGPHNMAIVRHMAMNLLRSAKPGKSLKVRRKGAGWDPNYLHAILRGQA